MKTLLLICLAVGIAAASLPTDSCSLCVRALDAIASHENVQMTNEDILNQLTQYCNVLPQQPIQGIPSQQECRDFITLYGNYIADLVLSMASSTDQVCEALQLCSSEYSEFTILFPTINDDAVVYSMDQRKVSDDTNSFKYRFFLGNSFDASSIKVELSESYGAEFYYRFSVEEPTTGDYTPCNSNGDSCSIAHQTAEQGQWYFVEIAMKKYGDAGFVFRAIHSREQVYEDYSTSVYIYVPVVALIFAFALCACLCICLLCCCCMCKKKCKSCKYKCQTQQYAPVPTNEQFVPMMFYQPAPSPVQVPMQTYAPAVQQVPLEREDQIAADERLARQLQEQINKA